MTGIPAFLAQAMKAALRARGYTDEEITQLEPERAWEILSTPDQREVREFIDTIIAQARAATKELPQPGLLQMLLVHPLDDGNVVPYRYALDDSKLVERMTSDAISASTAGHNVYIEARTVRGGLNGKQRGGLADTVVDATETNLAVGKATGFAFIPYSPPVFRDALTRCLRLYHGQPDVWRRMQETGMRQDWSWSRSAAEYVRLYQRAVSL